jgi:uncharacterized protein (UPF0297 family)
MDYRMMKGLNDMAKDTHEKTLTFSIHDDKERSVKEVMTIVYQALLEGGYDPIDQLVGYILSEDPTYITNHKNARGLIRRIDRYELMGELVREYLGVNK